MKKIILDGKKMINKEETHSYLKLKFDLADYYGNNLDALWDILSANREGLKIYLKNKDLLVENLGDYGDALFDLLVELDRENEFILFQEI